MTGSEYLPTFLENTELEENVVLTALNFTSLAANGPLPTDHIPENQVIILCQFIVRL